MTPEQADKLRAPFPPGEIGLLPKPYSKDSQKGRCEVCQGWHGLPAHHVEYVGHAAVTDRLLKVDPEWTWEPMARADNGLPLISNEGLWINLTVCGLTRPGFGEGATPKVMIGNAIRNAAMRFGVALDLWSKEDLSSGQGGELDPAEPLAPVVGRWAAWENGMRDLDVPDPMGWLRCAHEAAGGREKIGGDELMSRAVRVWETLVEMQPHRADTDGWATEELQRGFAAGFDGIEVVYTGEVASEAESDGEPA